MSDKQPLAIKSKIRDCKKNQPPRKMSDSKQNFFLKSVGNYCLNKISKHHTKNTEKYASAVAKPATVLKKYKKACIRWKQSGLHTVKNST